MKNLDKPVITDELSELSKKAYSYLFEQQEIIEKKFGIHQYENWYYDDETGILDFSNDDGIIVSIEYEVVGTISKLSNTWLWSWANPNIESKVNTDIETVKHFGIENNIETLVKPKWLADEYDGWEMTAIAAYLMKAKGAYRFPLENTYTFVVYKEILKKSFM